MSNWSFKCVWSWFGGFCVSLVIKSSCAEYLQVKLDSYSCSPVTTQNVVTSFRFYLFFVPAVKVTQPYRVVSTNGTAQIHCIIHSRTAASHLRPGQRLENLFSNQEDLQVALLRGLHGNQKICSSTLNTSEHEKEMQQEKDGDVRLLIEGAVIQVLTVWCECWASWSDAAVNEEVKHFKMKEGSITVLHDVLCSTNWNDPIVKLTWP